MRLPSAAAEVDGAARRDRPSWSRCAPLFASRSCVAVVMRFIFCYAVGRSVFYVAVVVHAVFCLSVESLRGVGARATLVV